MITSRSTCLAIFLLGSLCFSQDTTRHGYPVTPFFSSHPSTGVFSEFRNTLTSDHFHDGVDIPEPDGTPVYPVYSGRVSTIGTVPEQGDNAYVRVDYTVSGFAKSDAYIHISPNPLLVVGDSVFARQTVLGNILSGLGHVHFKNGGPSSSTIINAIRPAGGLTPYLDIYPPRIQFVRFFIDGTNTEFPANRVSGNVDIRVHVTETSASQPGELTSSTTNNGTYLIGYKILSADRSTAVYVPPSNGVRFRFDRMPLNAYVANVYATGSDLSTHIYTITNGNGADDVNATLVVNNNSWNSTTVPVGNYTVMVFTQDTRSLADTEYVPIQVTRQDLVPPAPPTLLSVINDSTNRITLRWTQSPESDLLGYRLQFSANGTTWTTRDNESRLTRTTTAISYPLTSSGAIYFRLVAVDSASPANMSLASDVYGMRINSSITKTLIVDGFDRTEASGSWHDPSHPFAMTHGQSLRTDFSTCANEEVVSGSVSLQNFNVVIWLLGDESTGDETFSPTEQILVQNYLRGGGKLFVSGSEVAWDLDRPGGPTQADRDFLHNFLKATYAGDDANENAVSGDAATMFNGINARYGIVNEGSPYEEDWPDFVTPETGASVILHYGTPVSPTYAGVAYRGVFPGGTQPGGVVYVAFPFETITSKPDRDSLMARVYRYFDIASDVSDSGDELPAQSKLFQNYPNPFNPETNFGFRVANFGFVELTVYDVLGREVKTIVSENLAPGNYIRAFDGSSLASGVYFYRLEAGSFSQTRRLLLLK